MKKYLVLSFFIALSSIVAHWSYNQHKKQIVLSELMLMNIEALAQNEGEVHGCTVSVSCGSGPNDYVKCTGKVCEREATTFSRWVKCDGTKTSC